jgi:magnesium transporter
MVGRDPRALGHGADRLLYLLADEVVAGYSPVVETIDDEIDRIEDLVFERPDSHILSRIFAVKRASYQLRRIISPQREVINKLARDDFAVIDGRDKIYFRDIYDHLVRLHDLSESLRDLIGGTLDTYLSVINNRMNDIMKTLTVITTLFMPLSFLTGFFGMNFFQPVHPLGVWTGLPAFVVTLLLVIATPLGMLWWIRRRGWM